MPLEFGNDFHLACEPIAWVWCEGNDPIRCRPIAVVGVVDVHLQEIHTMSIVHWYIDMTTILLTVLALVNVLLLAVLYSAPPIPVGVRSFWRNPVESSGMGPESTGIHWTPLDSAGFHHIPLE